MNIFSQCALYHLEIVEFILQYSDNYLWCCLILSVYLYMNIIAVFLCYSPLILLQLNEISVIQSVNSNNGTGLSPPGGKYASLLGFGGYSGSDRPIISEPPQSQPNSPLSDKPPSSPPPLSLSLGSHHDSPPLCESGGNDCPDREAVSRRMWDLHYDRKASGGDNDEPVGTSPSPPGHATPHPPTASRGEGLAAWDCSVPLHWRGTRYNSQ